MVVGTGIYETFCTIEGYEPFIGCGVTAAERNQRLSLLILRVFHACSTHLFQDFLQCGFAEAQLVAVYRLEPFDLIASHTGQGEGAAVVGAPEGATQPEVHLTVAILTLPVADFLFCHFFFFLNSISSSASSLDFCRTFTL